MGDGFVVYDGRYVFTVHYRPFVLFFTLLAHLKRNISRIARYLLLSFFPRLLSCIIFPLRLLPVPGIWSRLPVISSHPPFFGFAFSLTMIGYTFGFWPRGVLLAMAGSMTGAGVAFMSVRVRRVFLRASSSLPRFKYVPPDG